MGSRVHRRRSVRDVGKTMGERQNITSLFWRAFRETHTADKYASEHVTQPRDAPHFVLCSRVCVCLLSRPYTHRACVFTQSVFFFAWIAAPPFLKWCECALFPHTSCRPPKVSQWRVSRQHLSPLLLVRLCLLPSAGKQTRSHSRSHNPVSWKTTPFAANPFWEWSDNPWTQHRKSYHQWRTVDVTGCLVPLGHSIPGPSLP